MFQAVTSPVRPSIATNASGAVSSSIRMRASLWRRSRVRASVAAASRLIPASRRAISSPVTAGVPTTSSHRRSGPSWITSTTA